MTRDALPAWLAGRAAQASAAPGYPSCAHRAPGLRTRRRGDDRPVRDGVARLRKALTGAAVLAHLPDRHGARRHHASRGRPGDPAGPEGSARRMAGRTGEAFGIEPVRAAVASICDFHGTPGCLANGAWAEPHIPATGKSRCRPGTGRHLRCRAGISGDALKTYRREMSTPLSGDGQGQGPAFPRAGDGVTGLPGKDPVRPAPAGTESRPACPRGCPSVRGLQETGAQIEVR